MHTEHTLSPTGEPRTLLQIWRKHRSLIACWQQAIYDNVHPFSKSPKLQKTKRALSTQLCNYFNLKTNFKSKGFTEDFGVSLLTDKRRLLCLEAHSNTIKIQTNPHIFLGKAFSCVFHNNLLYLLHFFTILDSRCDCLDVRVGLSHGLHHIPLISNIPSGKMKVSLRSIRDKTIQTIL